jgi:hypothetical protein
MTKTDITAFCGIPDSMINFMWYCVVFEKYENSL